MSTPTEHEIDEVLDWCMEAEEGGRTRYPGMTYEQGVAAAIAWMRGDGDSPIDD